MPIDLTSHKLEASCALVSALFVACWRVFKLRSIDGDFFASVVEALLAGALLPAAATMIFYPFFDKPPDLSHYQLYLEIGGACLLFVTYIVIRRSLGPQEKGDHVAQSHRPRGGPGARRAGT